MAVYLNRNFTTRDYETTNVVACEADEAPATPDNRWEPASPEILAKLDHLWTERGVRYFGYL